MRLMSAIVVWFGSAYSCAGGIMLTPVSYAMQNGQSGANSYRDDTYGGPNATGNPAVNGSSLAGGLGQLTDNTIGTDDIFDNTSFEWVGWFNIQPVVTFDFGSVVSIDSIGVHAASNSRLFGDVDLPGMITITFSNDGVNFSNTALRTTSDEERANPSSQWLDRAFTSSRSARYVRVSFTDGDQPWVFLSEFRFVGVPTPGAATLGFIALVALTRRRR